MEPNGSRGQDLRAIVGRTFGFQNLQSTMFDVQRRNKVTRFTGHGYGHGVGLCVIGSMKLAAKGQSTASILSRYFPGTELGPFPSRSDSSVIAEPPLVLPPSEPAEHRRPLQHCQLRLLQWWSQRPAAPARVDRPNDAPRRDAAPSTDLVVVLPPTDATEACVTRRLPFASGGRWLMRSACRRHACGFACTRPPNSSKRPAAPLSSWAR